MKFTKLLSLVLALAMCFALALPMAAAESGSIKIDNAVVGQTYTIYRIFDLESYSTETGAYAYKTNGKWSNFVNQSTIKGVYVNIDTAGYVTWVNGASAADFAKLAADYAKANVDSLGDDGSNLATDTTVEFTNLALGYYLVDTSLGTLCSLNTTTPNITIEEKNAKPENEKTVEEDSDSSWGAKNDAEIGQVINFKSTITAYEGAESYILHDTMSAGLTFDADSVTVTENGTAVSSTNYSVVTSTDDSCTFHVVFTQDYCNTLADNDKIVVSYSATVNANAVVGAAGNPNESKLSYGENSKFETTPSQTVTYVWDFTLFKYTGTEKTPLTGAKFKLYKGSGENIQYAVIASNKVTRWTGNINEATEIESGADGKYVVGGLDAKDTYYLVETVAPAGYNLLTEPKSFSIPELTGEATSTTIVVEVENKTGAILPETGSFGTFMFTLIGSVMVIGAGVLLITRKKMSIYED